MLAVVADKNVRIFAAAVALLTKCGKEMTYEGDGSMITLRSLNDARSAFTSVTFTRDFFLELEAPPVDPATGDSIKRCKFLSRALLQSFHSLKNVEQMRLYFAEQDGTHFLVVNFLLRHDVSRFHSVYYEDEEVFQALFDRDAAPHYLYSRPAMFTRMLDNMKGTEEVTIIATPDSVTVQSFHGGSEVSTLHGGLRTTTHLPAIDFDAFHVTLTRHAFRSDGSAIPEAMVFDVTFSTREFRALLAFAGEKAVAVDEVALFFDNHGKPLLLTTQGSVVRPFKAELILATNDTSALMPEQREQYARHVTLTGGPAGMDVVTSSVGGGTPMPGSVGAGPPHYDAGATTSTSRPLEHGARAVGTPAGGYGLPSLASAYSTGSGAAMMTYHSSARSSGEGEAGGGMSAPSTMASGVHNVSLRGSAGDGHGMRAGQGGGMDEEEVGGLATDDGVGPHGRTSLTGVKRARPWSATVASHHDGGAGADATHASAAGGSDYSPLIARASDALFGVGDGVSGGGGSHSVMAYMAVGGAAHLTQDGGTPIPARGERGTRAAPARSSRVSLGT